MSEPSPNSGSSATTEEILGAWAIVVIVVLPALADGLLYVLSGSVHSTYLTSLVSLARGIADAMLVAVLVWRGGLKISEIGLYRPKFADLVLGILIGFFWFALPRFIMAQLNPNSYPEQSLQLPDFLRSGPGLAIGCWMLATAVVASGEELIFRAYLIPRFRKILNSQLGAVLLSSLFFSMCHLYQGHASVLLHFVSSVFIGGLYLLVPRLLPFAIGHTLCNILHAVAVNQPDPTFPLPENESGPSW